MPIIPIRIDIAKVPASIPAQEKFACKNESTAIIMGKSIHPKQKYKRPRFGLKSHTFLGRFLRSYKVRIIVTQIAMMKAKR